MPGFVRPSLRSGRDYAVAGPNTALSESRRCAKHGAGCYTDAMISFDPLGEAWKSGKKIYNAGDQAARKGKSIVGSGTDALAYGLVESAKQSVILPYKVLVRPTGRFVLHQTKNVVRGVVGFTGDLLKSIPWIPVPGRRGSTAPASIEEGTTLASGHNDPLRSPPPFPGPGRAGPGPGQNPVGPDVEPGPARRAA